MATYPASMDKKARWKAIANAVTGKSMKQCIARVKAIRKQMLAGRG